MGDKNSLIEEIPSDWAVKTLDRLVNINIESRDPRKVSPQSNFLYIDIESIDNESGIINSAKEILGKDAPSRARRVIHENDIIMSTVRPYLKAFAIVPKKYENQICSTGFAVLSSKGDLVPEYLLYSLFSNIVINQCNRMMVGGQYPALNTSQVKKIKIPVPSISEQQKIIEILSTTDYSIQKTNEIISKTEQLKRGMMHKLLTEGIGHDKFKDTTIGSMPVEWDIIKFTDIISKIKRGPSKKANSEGLGPVYLTSGNLTDEGFIDYNELKYLNPDFIDKMDKYLIKPNDLLINCVNSLEKVGKVSVFEGFETEVIIGFNNFAIELNDKVNPYFIKYILLQEFFKNRFRAISKPAVQQVSFGSKDLSLIRIPLAELHEQNEIVKILSEIDKKIKIEHSRKEKLQNIKKGLMNDLLTGRKRVHVNN